MLKTAELLLCKLLEHDSQVLSLKHISYAVEHELDRSLGLEALKAVQNGTSVGKALIFGAGAHSPYGSGPLHTCETSPSTRQLLGILGVIPDNNVRQDTSRQRLNISTVNQERKLDLRSNEAEGILLSIIATSTKDFSDAQQLLLDALLIDTMFADVNMSNFDLQTRKERLNKTIENIGAGLACLNLGKLGDYDITRKDFVVRWSAG